MSSLSHRHDGIGILIPTKTSERQYATSVNKTAGLANLVFSQEIDRTLLDRASMEKKKEELKAEKKAKLKQDHESIANLLNETGKKLTKVSEKGASSWLYALPLKNLG